MPMSATKAHHHDTIEAATRQAVKERPIIFSTDMVRAILAGRKTQTRRIIKPQPEQIANGWKYGKDFKNMALGSGTPGTDVLYPYECPYYDIATRRLWVRETWLPAAWDGEQNMIKALYKADMKKSKWFSPYQDDDDGEKFNHLWRSICDELDRNGIHPDADGMYNFQGVQKQPLSWRPSIHMPRAAARLILQITDIRVERLHSISEADAIAEGVEQGFDWYRNYKYPDTTYACLTAKHSFRTLWESINGPNSWGTNPWVWVITFAPPPPPLPIGEGPGVGPSETPPSAPPHTDPEPAAPAAAPPGQPPA